MKDKLHKVMRFLTVDVWRIQARDLPRSRFLLLKNLRIILLALRGFRDDNCTLRASALTFYTILSVVPIAAMAFGIAKGFGLEAMLEGQIRTALEGQEQAAKMIIDFAKNLLESAKGGVVAGVGVAILLWTVIKVLGNIEKAFNHVWGIKKHRSLARKFTDYISIMLVCPVLMVLSGGATVIISTKVEEMLASIPMFDVLGPIIVLVLGVLPFALGWGLFAFVYMFMPNTRVRLKSAIVAGVVAGTLFQLTQWGYINFQVGVSKYSAVYGSFAALPLFLVWLQISWFIVLFGAELSFAHQNVDTYEFEPDCLTASHSFKELLSLRTAQLLVKNFAEGVRPATASEISHELGMPIRLTNDILNELVGAGILSETKIEEEYKEVGYQPARPPEVLTAAYVLDALGRRGTNDLPVVKSKELTKLSDCMDKFAEAVRKSPANTPLGDA